MVDKIGLVKNPLTVIAIFAGLAEVSGTAVLPLMAAETQQTYIWFLMLFPVFLVTLFFVTLLSKHHVLYAPTDFRDDQSFTGLLVTATSSGRFAKLDQEVREVEAADQLAHESTPATPEVLQLTRRDLTARALLAEELVTTALGKEFGARFERNVTFSFVPNLVLDGVATLPGRTIVVEVKYSRTGTFRHKLVKSAFNHLRNVYQKLPESVQGEFEGVVAVVTEGDALHEHEEIKDLVTQEVGEVPFKAHFRVFDFASLDTQIGREGSSQNSESTATFRRRIVGLLGAGRNMNLSRILSELGVVSSDRATIAEVQDAIGTLVIDGKIEHAQGSVDEYRLKH